MSYLTFRIISLVILAGILLVFLANTHDKEDEQKANSVPKDTFQEWLKQASIFDKQKMLITSLVKFKLEYYKFWYDIEENDIQRKMKILFDALPKDVRKEICKDATYKNGFRYLDEDMLSDYISGCIEENPYLLPLKSKKG